MAGRFYKHVSFVVTLSSMAAPTALAAVINVPAGHATIQGAIDAAVNGDEIVVAPGTYKEAIDFLGKAIILRSCAGPEVTTIDGEGNALHVVRCFNGEGPDTVLDGFTITGGNAADGESGGGMYNFNSSPTVIDCIFSENYAAHGGGGMCNYKSSVTVTDCKFSGSSAALGAGMGNFSSTPTVNNCTFSRNVFALWGG
ncbi:MAG: right-handed parallel beta-helix repeat-containing protein, partial [Planctomycetes bacterium]|nr:right-handed parallel beta-helix repeat-containing protein [Planctomycetota bacterium]